MMNMHRALLLLAAACVAALPADAAAQQRFGPAVDASLGMGAGGGGTYVARAGAAMDAVIAVPVGGSASSTYVLGITGAANGPIAGTDVCVVGPGDTCVQDYPTFMSLGVLAGIQRQITAGLSSRVLVGPAYYQAVDGEDTFGLQGRVDVARPLVFHTALVASLRAAVLPSYEGEMLRFASFGLGLRIQ